MMDPKYEEMGDSDLELEIEEPHLYRVYLRNDDYTPMDFVVEVIMHFFHKSQDEARRIMLQVHHQGRGECGIYAKEIAMMKTKQVTQYARKNDHPLICDAEPT